MDMSTDADLAEEALATLRKPAETDTTRQPQPAAARTTWLTYAGRPDLRACHGGGRGGRYDPPDAGWRRPGRAPAGSRRR
jgi:hypothetical protein